MPHLRFRFSLRILWVSAASLALLAPFAALKILEPNPVAWVSSPVKTVPLPSSAAQQAVASLRQDATATRLAGLKAGPTSDAATRVRLVESYGRLPLSFEVNQGQSDPQVKFVSRGRGYTLFLTGDEAVLALRSRQSSVVSRQLRPTTDSRAPTINGLLPSSIINLQSSIDNPPAPSPQPPAPAVVRLKLVGTNAKANVAGLDELPGKSNYFLGNDPKKWRTNVPNYAQVRYKDVYPGIDLVYYGHQGQLEYDWVVSPGADPRVILLNVEGAKKMEIDAQGDLVLRADAGDVRLRKPLVYQATTDNGQRTTDPAGNSPFTIHHSQLLDGRYVLLANNQVSFEVTRYDKTKPLIIDPFLSYSTYLGGSDYDYGSGIAVDSAGNAYVTGFTSSTDFPTANPFQAANAGGADAFVTKLNAAGSALVYSTYLGGSSQDYGYGIAVDSAGNAYVMGWTCSTDFPTANPLQATFAGGYSDAFVTKLNAAGSALVYSTYLGGSGQDYGYGIAVDSAGNAYVTGSTPSLDFPATIGAFQPAFGGYTDAFVSKLNAAGSALVYSTYLGGSAVDVGYGIAVDSGGNAYVTGYTSSTNFPTAGPLQGANGGLDDAFVTKLNAAGSALVYSTYLGGSDDDGGYGIAVDSAGNAYVTGYTYSTNFPTTIGAFQPAHGGGTDGFVTKLNAAGSALVYSTYLGGSDDDQGFGIAVDSAGNAYVTGYTRSTDFPTANPLQAANGGGTCSWVPCPDTFVTKLNAAGSALVYSTYLGGSRDDYGYGIAVGSAGNAYITGSTLSTNFPTANPLQAANAGSADAFVAKISPADAPAAGLSPSSLVFTSQLVGTTSAARTVTLHDYGSASLNVTDISTSGDFAETDNCDGSVAAGGASCTISVTFTPTATGTRTGTLMVTDDAAGSPHVVSLAGTSVAPVVTLSPTSLNFGNQQVGAASAAQAVRLTNTGNATLTITSLAVSGDFAQTTTCLANTSPGGSCTFSVTFTPAALGTRTGSLTITDNATGSPQKVALSGVGVALGVSPMRLLFPRQAVGTTSRPQTVTLRNGLSTPLPLTSIKATGDFGQNSDCGGAIPASGSCTVRVVFAPTVAGTRNGFLTIRDAADSLSGSVLLSGLGVPTRKGAGSGRVASR